MSLVIVLPKIADGGRAGRLGVREGENSFAWKREITRRRKRDEDRNYDVPSKMGVAAPHSLVMGTGERHRRKESHHSRRGREGATECRR